MSHYEERLERDLTAIRQHVFELGERVEESLKDAVEALIAYDWDAANEVIIGDMVTNRSSRSLDRACHAFVVRHAPSAGHLRFVSSVLRISVALERLGDYAVTVARETVQMGAPLPDAVKSDVELVAHQGWAMLDQALHAFVDRDADLARSTMGQTAQVNMTFQKVYADLLAEGEQGEHPVKDLFALLGVIASIGRVSDHAKNICEETVFTVTGETKEPKVFRILFADRRNDVASQIAEAFARKAFPNTGRYESAGWEPAESVPPELVEFLAGQGLDLAGLDPMPFEASPARLADYHIVVALDDGVRERVTEVPYHTIVLRWDLPSGEDGPESADGQAAISEVYRAVTERVSSLVEALRGADAD
ncbi:MAG: phosphate signaling complex protein PhoU [Gemmatimonadota bacterium]|nr:phosphate signaling complex protein PhoU [Gemmatimonadota bacterium]